MTDPRKPVSDLRAIGEEIRRIWAKIERLGEPSGTQSFQAVKKLAAAVADIQTQQAAIVATQAELSTVVDGLEARLDAYLETEAPAIIDARVATQIEAILAGDVTIGGTLTAPGIRSNDITSKPDRVVVWVAGDGTVGHT